MMEEIPFRCLPYTAWQELTVKLEPNLLLGSDWRHLAEKLGYDSEDVAYFESRRPEKPCTLLLLGEYVKKESSTIQKLKTALEEMARPDAVKVLNNHMQEAEEKYKNEKNAVQQSPRTPDEVSYNWPSNSFAPHMYPSLDMHGHMAHQGMVNSMQYCPTSACHILQSPPCRHNSIPEPRHPMCNGYPSQNGSMSYIMSRGVQGHPYFSGEYTPPQHNGCQESMMVHQDPPGPGDMMSVDDIDMEEDNHRREEPAPLPRTIMRGDNQLSSFTHSQSMGQPAAIDVAREEEVETSGRNASYIAINHVGERQHGRPEYYGQNMGPKQPMSSSNRPYIIKGTIINMNSHQMMHDAGLRKVSSPPISKLQQLAQLPPCYQPNQEYKKIVADQKVEDERMGRPRQFKEEKIDAPSCSGHDHLNFTDLKKMQLRAKNGVRETPKTFPRVKTPTTGTVVGSLQMNQSNTLTKSSSMPVDMKPAEFRKAFRHIKVFVTYSNDSKNHLCHVLSLCNCMVKNGFSVCVDINSRYVSTLPNQHDKVNWYQEKFNESDFILVCPSAKYKTEIEAQELSKNGMMPESQLHTRYIYAQMLKEYRQHEKNTRFVPVLFQDSDELYLPSWLKKTLKYSWPSQYKDLLWMLTRPEDRIKPKPKLFSESTSQSNSPIHEDEHLTDS
ncbi:uncharacterized protein LOC124141086 [Haliotis rufescens]|uniref:uncharacterized protein LOC124141086 n=1 Tax=Haliotis rufescens TaxID=6454 RepID=UPI001EAF9A15|nr:uncharacterized protein LOC124141086 [Haliotis rufescens]